MPASNVCWGVELGASAIKAIKLERAGDDVNVLEYAVIPHKKVLSTPELDQNDAIRVAMGQLVSQFDLSGARIAISIPGHSAFARFAKLPPVEPKKIPDIVKFEAVQQIPFPIDQVEWDYQTFMSPDNPDVEVGIFAVMREKIMERLQMWNEVGVTPDYVTIGPVSVYNGVSWDQSFNDKTPGTVILDIGTTSTDLLVCEPGRVWIRTFQIGGHQFTEALVAAFKLSYSKAETLKAQAEQSKHARHILQAMRPVFGDLAQEVQRSIGYYQSSHRDANLTRLIALGSTFNLPGLRKYLGQQLQMEVIRLEKYNRLSVDGARGAEFEAATINMATAYGLALQGLGFKHGIMVNLMPTSIVREGVWKRKTKWFAAAAGLSVAAGGLAFFRPLLDGAQTSPERWSKERGEIQQVAGRINQLRGQWKEVESKFQTDFKAANVALLLNGRDIYPHLADDLGQIMKAAAEKAAATAKAGATPVGLQFLSFNTRYAPPADPSADPSGGGTGGFNSDSRGDARGGGGAAPAAGAGGEALAAASRVRVDLELQTTRPSADQFVQDTVIAWLRENSTRAGVPYVIDVASIRWDLDRKEVPKADDKNDPASTPGGGTMAGGGGGGGATPPGSKVGGGRLGGGGAGMVPNDDRLGDGMGGGSGASGPSSGPSAPGSGSSVNLDQIAPLPPTPPIGEPGQTIYRFIIHFDAVIKGPDAGKTENKS